MLEAITEFYMFPLKIFLEEKEPENYFSYKSVSIQGFRGLQDVSVNFSKNDLVLLLGLNESGKTSILKAIEFFDFNNDPEPKNLKTFFTSIRNKHDIDCSTPSLVTATIEFTDDIPNTFFKRILKEAGFGNEVKGEVEALLAELNNAKTVSISRVVPFNNGDPKQSYYQFENVMPLSSKKLGSVLAQEIVRRSPFIMYFEDFQDSIPPRIYTRKQSEAFNHIWYEIIDGLFYNTNKNYSIKKYQDYFSKNNRREDDAKTVMKQVNKTLQETFTKKWRDLSGVQEIDHAEIEYQEGKSYFEIKITENDGTTYSVHERSKGAVWYLAFLMKTEFRRKKLREGSGKPIYLIDEPASNLHSTAQTKMVEDFFKLVEDTTVVYTTHSRYLISPSNVKNTYVVKRSEGIVTCTRWGDYIKGKDAKISYYQPLYDCLDIVPTNFTIPWHQAIITEGPSDALVLEVMQAVLGDDVTHVIYPGASASDLSALISLNIGWAASFRILLDGDNEGIRQKQRYMYEFSLADSSFILLPEGNVEIEDMFSKEELLALYKYAFGADVEDVEKKQFLELMRLLAATIGERKGDVAEILSVQTKNRFRSLLDSLKKNPENHLVAKLAAVA